MSNSKEILWKNTELGAKCTPVQGTQTDKDINE